jgi:hypothetical protein
MPPSDDENSDQSESTFETNDYDPKQIAIIILIIIIIISIYLATTSLLA